MQRFPPKFVPGEPDLYSFGCVDICFSSHPIFPARIPSGVDVARIIKTIERIFFDYQDYPRELEMDLVLSGQQVARMRLSWDFD